MAFVPAALLLPGLLAPDLGLPTRFLDFFWVDVADPLDEPCLLGLALLLLFHGLGAEASG